MISLLQSYVKCHWYPIFLFRGIPYCVCSTLLQLEIVIHYVVCWTLRMTNPVVIPKWLTFLQPSFPFLPWRAPSSAGPQWSLVFVGACTVHGCPCRDLGCACSGASLSRRKWSPKETIDFNITLRAAHTQVSPNKRINFLLCCLTQSAILS